MEILFWVQYLLFKDALECVLKQKMCKEWRKSMLKTWKDFLKEEEGMGTVEVILIIVVLISLVVIFKEQLTSLVESIFDKITKQAKSI